MDIPTIYKDTQNKQDRQSDAHIYVLLERIEAKVDSLLRQPTDQEFYDVTQFAKRVERKVFTVRAWCREGRVNAIKRQGGRGTARSKEWQISHQELQRYLNHGLLPSPQRYG